MKIWHTPTVSCAQSINSKVWKIWFFSSHKSYVIVSTNIITVQSFKKLYKLQNKTNNQYKIISETHLN